MKRNELPISVRKNGLYCPAGDFYIDAWSPVPVCLVTHAHGDHARYGHGKYICTPQTADLLKYRLGVDSPIKTYGYNETFSLGKSEISFHSAGHILGSAQIKIVIGDVCCVISGDYKRQIDKTCDPFELIHCDIFVTESTFALPIYRWENPELTAQKIFDWWQENRSQGLSSIIFCYALGKAQRILSLLHKYTNDSVYAHGAILPLAEIYKKYDVQLLPFLPINEKEKKTFSGDLIIAPPVAKGSPWMKKFYPYKTAFASGWMQVRGVQRQRNVDRGFVLSDHADWNDLLQTVQETGAHTILTTHGNAEIFAKFLSEQGLNAESLHGTERIEEGEG